MRGEDFEQDDDGAAADVWLYEGRASATTMTVAAAGFRLDDLSNEPMTFDRMRPGCYDPRARLDDMDAAGVEGSACFPNTFVRFCGQRFLLADDKDAREAVCRGVQRLDGRRMVR